MEEKRKDKGIPATASTRSTAWVKPADYKYGTVQSTHPSLAAQPAN